MQKKIGFYKTKFKLTESELKILNREVWYSWTVAGYQEFSALLKEKSIETVIVITSDDIQLKDVFSKAGFKIITELDWEDE